MDNRINAIFIFLFVAAISYSAEVEDGIYTIHNRGEGVQISLNDGSKAILGEKVGNIVDRVTVKSITNDNSLYALTLFAVPLKTHKLGFGAISAAGVFVTFNGTSPRENGSYVDALVEGEAEARKLSARFNIVPVLRKHPQHQMAVRWATAKRSYQPHEPVVLRLVITNVGKRTIRFDASDRQNRRDNSFSFTVYKGNGKVVPDTGDTDDSGLGLVHDVSLDFGEKFETKAYLDKWFRFSEPDTYEITCSYRISLKDAAGQNVWDEFATGKCDLKIDRQRP